MTEYSLYSHAGGTTLIETSLLDSEEKLVEVVGKDAVRIVKFVAPTKEDAEEYRLMSEKRYFNN